MFITADQNIEFQQNLARSRLFVLVLIAPSNALEDLLPLVPSILAEMPNAQADERIKLHRRSLAAKRAVPIAAFA